MGYPDQIDIFKDKLNKKANGGSYVIEEKLTLTKGVYSGLLAHDNINNQSITSIQVHSILERNYVISLSLFPMKRLGGV